MDANVTFFNNFYIINLSHNTHNRVRLAIYHSLSYFKGQKKKTSARSSDSITIFQAEERLPRPTCERFPVLETTAEISGKLRPAFVIYYYYYFPSSLAFLCLYSLYTKIIVYITINEREREKGGPLATFEGGTIRLVPVNLIHDDQEPLVQPASECHGGWRELLSPSTLSNSPFKASLYGPVDFSSWHTFTLFFKFKW